MAEATKNVRKRKVFSEDKKQRKREKNKLNARTRINIGLAFTRWREIKDEEGCPTTIRYVGRLIYDEVPQKNLTGKKYSTTNPERTSM